MTQVRPVGAEQKELRYEDVVDIELELQKIHCLGLIFFFLFLPGVLHLLPGCIKPLFIVLNENTLRGTVTIACRLRFP